MQNKTIPFLVVGILIGLVAGFFLGRGVAPTVASLPAAGSPASDNEPALPEDHPSPEFIEQLQALEQHAGEHAEDIEARVALGNAYYDMGRFTRAIQWYEEAMQLDDQNPNVATDLGTAYFYAGNSEKAIDLFHYSLNLQEDHPQTLQNLGWVQFQTENFEAAVQAWERLLAVHPDYEQAEAVRKQLEVVKEHLRGEHS